MYSHKNNNEIELIQRIASGDELAFKTILDTYSDQLGAFVFKVTFSKELAEEIVQDVFMKIWQQRGKLTEVAALKDYIFILTRNLTYNHIRKQARESVHYRNWLHVHAMEKEPDNATDYSSYLPLIADAIDQLPPQQKKVFQMARAEGLTHSAIADAMNISPETVKKYMKIALQSIREKISKEAPESFTIIASIYLGLS